jgi:hypothetical protein
MLQQVHLAMSGIWTLIVIGAVCTGSCKPNYHSITTTTASYINIFKKKYVVKGLGFFLIIHGGHVIACQISCTLGNWHLTLHQ